MGNLGIGSRIKHATLGEGVVCGKNPTHYRISFPGEGIKMVLKDFTGLQVIEKVEEEVIPAEVPVNPSIQEMEKSLRRILEDWSDVTQLVKLADKWHDGKMILKPVDEKLTAKEIPLDQFFHKIVMLRDRLRVLEQKINAHEKFSDADKVEMQQYITRIYGSLTTFNILFKSKDDHFVGAKGE